ncbi:MerR family transcriptional regulator [Listeria seeligeri]|uniref:MerR family transcriptional regulator n=1 Tax=Listeria seeligeri TaxID=1640 RepID=UPI001628F2C9|nr:MerR family transcriptional regulator [Listeria seeligeri]MBC1757045.1 MerR family transcriptional regulator [Listeria seeligeri]MBC1814739.1 MerR family transcriptional regulator [Listeria seeligeri]MBC2029043.1 MerR family transcriptional regulator [Listeria seeligeri]MBC6114445.1 MerR family transcriptional regulator [Listeria seeligeri]MBC6159184.1 MerR family transcriptional regulator [Listeria seeligeri]
MYIKEFSIKTGLSIDTLRYYEEEKLLIPARNDKNYRVYTEEDYCWVQLLLKMKQTSMTLANIKEFAKLQKLGDESLPERIRILDEHLEKLFQQQTNLMETITFVSEKMASYQRKVVI